MESSCKLPCVLFVMSTRRGEEANQKPDVAVTAARDTWNSAGPNTSAVTGFVAGFDEVAKRRLDNMNQKLRDLERQMEVLEAEMNRANDYERMLLETPRLFGS
ncbi:uncharacterized protein LOC131240991 [Magnolia sinica]|uniref:uncharacterized protein LOC131240991 n=1 Tax=Magnolia sinica TaxID=86752 RepID=UPI002659F77F|nr:uncharacterized protein LOC131240991 [Magnolia sinica]